MAILFFCAVAFAAGILADELGHIIAGNVRRQRAELAAKESEAKAELDALNGDSALAVLRERKKALSAQLDALEQRNTAHRHAQREPGQLHHLNREMRGILDELRRMDEDQRREDEEAKLEQSAIDELRARWHGLSAEQNEAQAKTFDGADDTCPTCGQKLPPEMVEQHRERWEQDHARCWEKLAGRGVPLYASDGTIAALGAEGAIKPLAPEVGQDVSAPVRIGSFSVLSFRIFHDAAEPVGFLIRSTVDGEKLAFATDTGNIRYQFPGLSLLAIEANYQEEILARCTRIPEATVKRIRYTHMEIGRLCGYLSGLDLSGCRELYLLHLSDASSDEAWFAQCVRRVVPETCRVMVCEKGG